MAKSPLGQCRSCGANVYWLKNVMTGRTAPIDADPVEGGNVEVNLTQGTYRVRGAHEPAAPHHRNHFITCPDQDRWRQRRLAAKV